MLHHDQIRLLMQNRWNGQGGMLAQVAQHVCLNSQVVAAVADFRHQRRAAREVQPQDAADLAAGQRARPPRVALNDFGYPLFKAGISHQDLLSVNGAVAVSALDTRLDSICAPPV